MSAAYHTPVLLHQCIEALQIRPDGIYVDATYGGGGHSAAIATLLTTGKLFAFDQDEDAAKNILPHKGFKLLKQNFRYMQKFLRVEGITKVDGILADLGVSSHQFDEAERGFSIRFDADLDMRMDNTSGISAADVVNTYSEKQLLDILSQYGEIRNSKQLASALVIARKHTPINSTAQLKEVVLAVAKGEQHKYLAQVFQAIRIEVNDELNALKEMLTTSIQLLKPGGRLAVVSYHSLEDRIVKNIIKTGNAEGDEHTDMMGRRDTFFKQVTKKPLLPDDNEMKQNPRSRSAKLRIAEKL